MLLTGRRARKGETPDFVAPSREDPDGEPVGWVMHRTQQALANDMYSRSPDGPWAFAFRERQSWTGLVPGWRRQAKILTR